MGRSKLTKEVRLFFSSSNQLVSPFKDAGKLKGITNELSLAARNHAHFGSIFNKSSLNQTRTLSCESGSYASTDMIVGRDGDRDYMVNLLLDSSSAAGILSVASIVGMGGVGKTTLAQYVYSDDKIKRYFDLQLWVSNTQEFNVKDVLRKILACATDEEPLHCEMDQLQRCLFRAIAGKRFMLVLDGVWDQEHLRAKWLELTTLLRVGNQGSKVLLTTRSNSVARMMGTQEPYIVGDLGDDDSWLLFQHVATTEWHEPGVEAIGKEIAKMCPRVPLVIRAIGSLLAGKHTVQEWRAFRNDQLTNFTSYGRDITSTLKLSYDQLDVELKPCVAYCSLFPKGFDFQKSETLGHFVLGKPRNSFSLGGSNADLVCGLADFSHLDYLKGKLTINVVDRSENIVTEAKAAKLDRKEITYFCMKFRESKTEGEMVLDNLKPGASLERLYIEKYGGQRLPCWMREGIHRWLPNLVDITISDCESCIHMCSFGRLPHLRNLYLQRLNKVEYIENGSSNNDKTTVVLADEHPSTPLFPSLVYLRLTGMPQLKGWWSVTDSAQDQGQNKLSKWVPAFPKLNYAEMDMEVLISLAKTSFQRFSSLRSLYVVGKSKAIAEQTSLPSNVPAVQKQPRILLKSYIPKLLEVIFLRIETESLPEEFRGMSSLKSLGVNYCEALEGIPEWIDSLTSLECLSMTECLRVKSLPHEISNLTNLKSRILEGCSRQLEERCKETTGEDWPKIQHIPNIRIVHVNDDES